MTERQKRFVDGWLKTANATQAARLAGYSERSAGVTGDRLLKKANIAAAIDERLKLMESARIIETEEVLEHLSAVIRGQVTETIVTPGGKEFEVPVREADRLRASEMILKIRGMFRDKVDVKVNTADLFVKTLESVLEDERKHGGVKE